MKSGGALWGRALPSWPHRRHSPGPCIFPGWPRHSPGVDSKDLSDEEGSTLRDVGVQPEGIKAPCQDAVLRLDGVQFKEWRPPTEPVRVERVVRAEGHLWEGTQHPLPTHLWFGTATAAQGVSVPVSSWEGSAGLQDPPAHHLPSVPYGTKPWVQLNTPQSAHPSRPFSYMM